ncbi:MAG: hypothetical protein LC713_03940 [Actinobacteria bacterium]|nr:hypothetical protein [Actinomycetota bacterium]
MVLLAATVVILTGSATATPQFNPGPVAFPDPAFVGQTGLPAVYEARNSSTPPDNFTNLFVESMTLVPSCSNFSPQCSGGIADPDVFQLSSTGTGEPNTACAGQVFDIGVLNPVTGEVAFTPPPGPLSGPGSIPTPTEACRIDFTVDVLKLPTVDSNPTSPGIQTNQVGSGVAHLGDPTGSIVTGGSSLEVTVVAASPAISTVAVPRADVGDPITDTATLSGGVNPTGTITFAMFGAADSTCLDPLFTSNVNIAGNGSYVSAPFFASSAGTYKWRARYSGDAINQPFTSPCDDPDEVTVVTQASPVLTTNATASGLLGTAITDTATLSNARPPSPSPATAPTSLHHSRRTWPAPTTAGSPATAATPTTQARPRPATTWASRRSCTWVRRRSPPSPRVRFSSGATSSTPPS